MAVQPAPLDHSSAVTTLAQSLTGDVITPDDPAYDSARRVWNGMIDKRPAVIARCADADDVAVAVTFAADRGLPLAVRGGGHNVAGTAVVDDGLVVDLSSMRGVLIDESRRTVHVQGGATWGDVDRVTQPLGLATPGGVVSETGVAGLALNGGVSHQRRLHGMTVDNLVSAKVVLADGRQVRASADEHSDLYWALRGGGGNFGIVTSFELRLHELGPEVFELNVAYPIEDAARVIAGWRDVVADAPDELSTAALTWSLPVIPELPEHLRGRPFVGVAGMYAGSPEEGERVTRRLRELATPLLDMSQTVAYLDLQRSLDPMFPAGLRYYWKALYLDGMSDAAIETTVSWAQRQESD
jgi:FAD/FMN-containing dehydrogenase